MRFAIAYYKNNIAGKNIADRFRELGFFPQIPVIELKKETLYSDDLNSKNYPELKNIDFLVFASTHRSEKNQPSLCLHAPGNWRDADLGGKPGKVCPTSANVLKYLFQELKKNAVQEGLSEEYHVTMEATHHGPIIDIPCCFIEIGSNENKWTDKKAAAAIAKTILSLQNFNSADANIPAVGIGGPHYCPNFNDIQLNTQYAISHIIPIYNLPLTESMIMEAEKKTKEQIMLALIDWKGLGKSEERQKVLDTLEKCNLSYKRTSHIK
jgi:D-aminoacyl-tRNA deacylase